MRAGEFCFLIYNAVYVHADRASDYDFVASLSRSLPRAVPYLRIGLPQVNSGMIGGFVARCAVAFRQNDLISKWRGYRLAGNLQ
jgi:hypothetical protein